MKPHYRLTQTKGISISLDDPDNSKLIQSQPAQKILLPTQLPPRMSPCA